MEAMEATIDGFNQQASIEQTSQAFYDFRVGRVEQEDELVHEFAGRLEATLGGFSCDFANGRDGTQKLLVTKELRDARFFDETKSTPKESCNMDNTPSYNMKTTVVRKQHTSEGVNKEFPIPPVHGPPATLLGISDRKKMDLD
eukprot:gene18332-24795_t